MIKIQGSTGKFFMIKASYYRLIYQTMTPKPVIMLEDVTVSGFDTPIKSVNEDFELSKMVIKRLAKFHAASFFLQDEQV